MFVNLRVDKFLLSIKVLSQSATNNNISSFVHLLKKGFDISRVGFATENMIAIKYRSFEGHLLLLVIVLRQSL